jgi:hypothetical protein
MTRLFQSKSGRKSAPRLPQAPQTKRGSMSESLWYHLTPAAIMVCMAKASGRVAWTAAFVDLPKLASG